MTAERCKSFEKYSPGAHVFALVFSDYKICHPRRNFVSEAVSAAPDSLSILSIPPFRPYRPCPSEGRSR